MPKTSSSEIGGSEIPDLKYQKAIKEIGKLVNINTALKKEISVTQERYDSLRVDYENLRECYEQLEASFEDRTPNRTQNGQKVPIEQELEIAGSMKEIADLKKKIEQLQQIVGERDERITQLQQSYQIKHEESIELFKKNSMLEQQLSEIIDNNTVQNVRELEKSNQSLEKQLKKAQQWGAQLSKDVESFKKQSFMSQLSIKDFPPKSSQFLQEKSNEGADHRFLIEKIKKLQRQLIIHKQLAKQVHKLKKQVKALKQLKSSQQKKIVSLSNFMNKQQEYIEKFSAEQLRGPRNI